MKLLDALQGKNRGRPPIWLMRQAGRYLPEYRELRSRHTLRELFFTPKLAAQATLMPTRRFGFDAAILFSDITAIAPALGFELEFNEGPSVQPLATRLNWALCKEDLGLLDPIAESVVRVKEELECPLIGFCGGPYTIATYLTGNKTEEWIRMDPEGFDAFLASISQMCIHSLQRQVQAGVDVVQIFDSWADQLDDASFDRWSLHYLKQIREAVDCPTILFMRGSSVRWEKLSQIKEAAISLDGGKVADVRRALRETALQGNLDPDLLFQPVEVVRQQTRALLDEMKDDPAFIVNLSHGVKPNTPLEAVQALVDEVRRG